MANALKNLLLALLNATLILVALCLFLGWKLATTVQDISLNLRHDLQLVTPLRDQAQGIRGELVAIRSDLATIRDGDTAVDGATTYRISAALDRLEEMEERLQSAQAGIAQMSESPEILIDHAIQSSADAVADRIIAIKGCAPAS